MYFLVGKTNGRLVTVFKVLCFFVKKSDDRLDTVFKMLCFDVKRGWPFGCNFNILHFAVKYELPAYAISTKINPCVTFLYPLKTSGNLWFSDVFRGYRNVTLD